MEIIAKTEHLSHSYPGGIKALNNINLTLYKHDITAIIGQNGSGKTTLSKHFNGLLKATKGNVLVNDHNIARKKVSEMAKDVGYVFQNPSYQLFCSNVKDEIKFGLKNLKLNDREIALKAREVMERFHLTEYAKSQPMTLGSGMKKIVALASVYVMNPSLLILDEPTTGQDQPGKSSLGELMLEMASQGKSVLVVTHDMNFVSEYAKRVIVMANGEIIKEGTPDQIFTDESVMNKAHIQPPQIYAIANFLKKSGMNIQNNEINIKHLAQLISERSAVIDGCYDTLQTRELILSQV